MQAEPSPPSSPSGPLSQLVIAAEQKAASDTEEAAPHSDADAEAPPRKRARKKLGHYQPKLSSLDRLEVLRLSISEGKTAKDIARDFASRGLTVPQGTIYSIIRKQAQGKPIDPQIAVHHRKYTEEDAKLVVQAQIDHSDYLYTDLRKVWLDAHPEAAKAPSNATIHKWLKAADITGKMLYAVPRSRNHPAQITARRDYSLRAMTWERERLIFIDETTFSKGLHSTRGRSKKGKPAHYISRDSAGPGLKVCAAVSPTVGLVMYERRLQAYDGDSFSKFMQRLAAHPACKGRSMIMVMDNVAMHFTPAVQAAMEGLGVHHDIELAASEPHRVCVPQLEDGDQAHRPAARPSHPRAAGGRRPHRHH